MLLVKNNVLPLVDADVEVGHPADGPADDVQVVPAVVVAPLGEEGAVDVAQVVVDRSAAAVAPGQLDGVLPEEGHVGLGPGVLVPPDHDAGVVAPEKQEMLKEKLKA